MAGIHDLNDLELDARLARASMLPREESILLAEALPLARRLNDTRQLLAISHRLAQLRPASEGFELQAKYYALLMGEALGKQPLAPAKADAAHVLVAALAAYRLNDEKRLAELLNPAPDATAMQPGMRAVMAGLLARIGESARTVQLAEKIQLASLLPEEKRFWELARMKAKGSIAGVAILVDEAVCAACLALPAAAVYHPDEAPHLPLPECSKGNRCRCVYRPVMTYQQNDE